MITFLFFFEIALWKYLVKLIPNKNGVPQITIVLPISTSDTSSQYAIDNPHFDPFPTWNFTNAFISSLHTIVISRMPHKIK